VTEVVHLVRSFCRDECDTWCGADWPYSMSIHEATCPGCFDRVAAYASAVKVRAIDLEQRAADARQHSKR